MTTLMATPSQPWKPSLRKLWPEFLGVLITLLATFAIVGVTPLKGKLGFVLTLIVVAAITSAVVSWIQKDRKAAAIIDARLTRVRMGNLGNSKSVGHGVSGSGHQPASCCWA
jgi:hypothetical protein